MTEDHIIPKGVLFGLCCPLVDISAVVPREYLDRYDLNQNGIILAQPSHRQMYQELVDQYNAERTAGGSGLNSIRVAQWMLQKPFATSFMGCVGDDEDGRLLVRKVESDGVQFEYLVDRENRPTGVCACLITQTVRSLVANRGAAEHYKVDHLKVPKNWALVEASKVCYITGFFLTICHKSILEVAEHCSNNNKAFTMNLSAEFVPKKFKKQFEDVLPYVDILFGNESEARSVSEEFGYGTSNLKEIACRITRSPKKNDGRKRVVIITQGSDPVLLCTEDKVTEHPILPITEENIVDTTGAGDAWVGGFLSQFVLGRGLEDCIRGGHYAASVVIQNVGCTFPPKPDFELS